jgi:hypothetical protein
VRFNDENLPENGGKIEILLTATSGRMFDNICIDSLGRLFLQEDTGNQAHVAKIYCYGIDSGEFLLVAQHNPDLFLPGGPNFITTDEESSGIIDAAEILGPGWFIFNVESHASVPDPELVQGGQLLAMHVPTYIGRTGVSVRPSL